MTGNVIADSRAMTGPGGVVLEDARHLDRFAGHGSVDKGAQFWLQINIPAASLPIWGSPLGLLPLCQ
ncbi:hypothetical protein ACU4GD_27435 [Cupriavidus basilensis]